MRVCPWLLVVVLALATPAPARAEVEASLPLQGYFRVGQYVPVHLRATHAASLNNVTLAGEGVLATVVSARGSEIVVPVLIMSAGARELTVSTSGGAIVARLPLRELPADRQVIGVIRESASALDPFVPPAPTVVRVPLDRALVNLAPAIALEMMQTLVLDDPAIVGDVSAWAASGVQLLLVWEDQPDDEDWPWVAFSGVALFRFDPLGPRGAVLGETAYPPTLDWRAGASPQRRRQIVLAAVLFTIAAIACALLPQRKFALPAVGLVTLGTLLIVHAWQRSHSPLRQLGGQVAVDHRPLVQWDRWTYFTAVARARGSMPLLGAARPVLVDAAHAQTVGLRLHWGEDASQRYFSFELVRDVKIGFVSRTVATRSPAPPRVAANITTALAPLARQFYVKEDYAIAAQAKLHDGPLVHIVRQR